MCHGVVSPQLVVVLRNVCMDGIGLSMHACILAKPNGRSDTGFKGFLLKLNLCDSWKYFILCLLQRKHTQ